jgi:hypothetical protein
MTTQQPEALRLADELDAVPETGADPQTIQDAAAELRRQHTECDALTSAAAIAWGWLWHVTTEDDRVKTARHLLGQFLSHDMKRYGIQTAMDEGARVNVQEIEAAMLRGEF